MKKSFLTIFLVVMVPYSLLANCYLLLEGKQGLSQTALEQIALIEMSRYVEPLMETPSNGISDKDCVYRLTLSELGTGILLVIKGPRLTSYADSDLSGIQGFQQALFRTIIKENPEKKSEICQKHQKMMADDCAGKYTAAPIPDTDLIVHDMSTSLSWQKGESGKLDWETAGSYCQNLDFAGYTDWRLPNSNELKSSYLIRNRFPKIEDYYWSSTPNVTDKYYAWGFSAADGDLFSDWIKNRYFARCVRGEEILSPVIPAADEPSVNDREATVVRQTDSSKNSDPIGFRWAVGPTYVSGFKDISDIYIHNIEEQGYSVEDEGSAIPIGISFRPYYQFESGLRVGVGIGPLMYIGATSSQESYSFVALPIDANVGFNFPFGLYLRGGISRLNTSGDFIKSEAFGVAGLVGMEFKRRSRVSFGFEAGMDTASVSLEKYDCSNSGATVSDLATCDSKTEKINLIGATASFLVIF